MTAPPLIPLRLAGTGSTCLPASPRCSASSSSFSRSPSTSSTLRPAPCSASSASSRAAPLRGLLALDLLLVIANLLAIPVFLALYVALRKASPSFMALALALGLVGIAAYYASNTSFNMLALSQQYAAATSEAQKASLQAAGQAMLAIYTGTAFQVNYIIGAIALIIISVVMLRGGVFSKATAYLGILANTLALGLYLPAIGIYVSIFSVLFLAVWEVLIGLRFFQLAQLTRQAPEAAPVVPVQPV